MQIDPIIGKSSLLLLPNQIYRVLSTRRWYNSRQLLLSVLFLFWYVQKDGVGKGSFFFFVYNGGHDRNRGRPGFLFFSRRSKILYSVIVQCRTILLPGPTPLWLASFPRSAVAAVAAAGHPCSPFSRNYNCNRDSSQKIIDPLILDLPSKSFPSFFSFHPCGPFTELVRPRRCTTYRVRGRVTQVFDHDTTMSGYEKKR